MKDKYILLDPAQILGMGKIQNFKNEKKPFLKLGMDFIRDNSDIKVYFDMVGGENFTVWKGDKKWGKYNKAYYDRAMGVVEAWSGGSLVFFVSKKKNEPLLMACDDLGFIVAPRVDGGEDD